MKEFLWSAITCLIIFTAVACDESVIIEKKLLPAAAYSEVKVDSVVIINPGGTNLFPVFSEDDKSIFFTKVGYVGIYKYDIEKKTVVTITTVRGTGYSFAVTDDDLYYVIFSLDTETKERLYDLVEQNLKTGKTKTIYKTDKRIQGVKNQNSGQLSFFVRDSLFIFDTNKKEFIPQDQLDGQSYLISKGMLRHITRNGIKEYLISDKNNIVDVDPINEDSLLVNVAVEGLYLFNTITSSKDSLDKVFFPRWNGKNLYAYTYQATDGHKIDTSRIFVKSLDGSLHAAISTDRVNLDENPSWSHDGRKIVYNNFNGVIKLAYLSYH